MINTQFVTGFITAMGIGAIVVFILYRRWNKQKVEILENHNRFVHVIENSRDFIYYYEVYPKRQYHYLSPSAEYFFGKGSIERAYKNPDIPFLDVHPDDYDLLLKKVNGEVDYSNCIIQRWKDKDGNYRWFEEYATPIYENGKLVALQGVLRNIDEKIELQEQLQYQLHHDILTGIYNRNYFEKMLAKYNEESNASVGIILCDLDELKYTNDNFGHKKGDDLIKLSAAVLNQFSSDTVTVARIGGDEFVLLAEKETENEVKQLADSILKEIDMHNGNLANIKINLSVGYAYTPTPFGEMRDLFSQADKNMYSHKQERKKLLV